MVVTQCVRLVIVLVGRNQLSHVPNLADVTRNVKTHPAPEEIIEHDDNDNCEDDIERKKICVSSGKCATVRCYCRSEGLSSNYKCCCKECTNNKPHSEETDSECEDVLTKELEINILRSRWCI